jgi:NusA-like KH domain protein
MANTIDMQDMRHLNLFEKITKIRTRFCFMYNETIFFCVPKQFVSKAIGERGRNIKNMSEILRRKIKIIPIPNGIEHAKYFIESIVAPVEFKEIQISKDEIILTAWRQSKAALIGRNKRRLMEMKKIIGDFFGRDFKIA